MKTSILVTISIFLFCISCGQRIKNKDSQISTETLTSNIEVQPKLDSLLEQAVYELKGYNEQDIYGNPLSESIVIMYFKDKQVLIYHNSCSSKKYLINDYKGVMDIGDYKVAIFDGDNIGQKFYNADSLQLIPLDSFKCYQMDVLITPNFYIKDDKLINWKEGLRLEAEGKL